MIASILSDYHKYFIQDQWTFARGALATVDRPLFGWVGRFFLHNVGVDLFSLLFLSNCEKYQLIRKID
jgi:putative flippase GtrA